MNDVTRKIRGGTVTVAPATGWTAMVATRIVLALNASGYVDVDTAGNFFINKFADCMARTKSIIANDYTLPMWTSTARTALNTDEVTGAFDTWMLLPQPMLDDWIDAMSATDMNATDLLPEEAVSADKRHYPLPESDEADNVNL